MKILANDGISENGIAILENTGLEVIQTTVSQGQLGNYITKNNIEVLLVRNTTKVDKELIDNAPSLKIIGRSGTDMSTIDVAYAISKNIKVINTPNATANAIAEMVFAHMHSGVRFLYDANRNMPLEGDSSFNQLKKSYSIGTELRGKTIGLIGLDKSGEATAKLAIAAGMNVVYHDKGIKAIDLELSFFDDQKLSFNLKNSSKKDVLSSADFISIHTKETKTHLLGKEEFSSIKKGTAIINTTCRSAVDEVSLISSLEDGTISFAGLDVFESEPQPEIRILMHSSISLSPHIAEATLESQERIGAELAEQLIDLSNKE